LIHNASYDPSRRHVGTTGKGYVKDITKIGEQYKDLLTGKS